MGYTSIDGYSRSDIIREVTAPDSDSRSGAQYRTIAHSTAGNHLWTVKERRQVDGTTELGIVLYLLCKQNGRWAYKDMDEIVGPYYYSCPLAYLDQVPDPQIGESTKWRQKVREYHATQASQKAKAASLAIGQKWSLVGARGLTYVVIGRVQPTISGQCDNGRLYRIPAKMLGELLDERAIPYAAEG